METNHDPREKKDELFKGRPETFLQRWHKTEYDEYLMAMKRIHPQQSTKINDSTEILSPRVRYREQAHVRKSMLEVKERRGSSQEALQMSVIASIIPDEIIYNHHDYSVRSYETALMFIDVTGFTNLCEKYTSSGRGGPSKLTQVLNSYIGSMLLEILAHNGDVLNFSGDAFLSMWKKSDKLSMQDVVHNAIDCGLIIQKNYGTFITDIGVTLKVKVAISAGRSYFSIIGGQNQTQSSYVVVGQPVWDVKMTQYMTTAGEVLTSASAWMYVNEAEYCTQPCRDGIHTKVLGVGVSWKRVEKLEANLGERGSDAAINHENRPHQSDEIDLRYVEYQLRPAVITALKSMSNMEGLRRFVAVPVLRAIDNDEPMDFLTEVRHVVVVFLNIITKTVSPNELIEIVNTAYNCVSSVTSQSGGHVNKVSMFDKDMMFLVVFGLRGLKHENEAQNAILCAYQLMETLVDDNILSVSVGVTSGSTYCGVVGHVFRREYTVIGSAVNKAARLMTTYHDMVSCDKETFLRSKLNHQYFKQLESKPLKGIPKMEPMYQFSKTRWSHCTHIYRHPILGRKEELRKFSEIIKNAQEQQTRSFTRCRDHKFAVVYSGIKYSGMTRLLEESLALVPETIRCEKFVLTEKDLPKPYSLIRRIMSTRFMKRYDVATVRDTNEKVIRYSLSTIEATPIQLYGLNLIFDCRFPLPEKFEYTGDILSEASVKQVVKDICMKNFITLWVFGIDDAHYIDVESWRLLLVLLETKAIFLVMSVRTAEITSPVVSKCLENHMIVTIPVRGIDRFYHAALACQLLDVQAIPADLEKVVESASGGLPGWVQNFVISLVQRKALTVVTMPWLEALKQQFVLPSIGLLQSAELDQHKKRNNRSSQTSMYSYISESLMSKQGVSTCELRDSEKIQVALLAEGYIFDNMNVDMTMDAIILKTYDSLNPFEKMLLKCGSVLGDVFSRRMLLHLLQGNSPRKVAEAVAKLFSRRVLECEGGDFTRDTSLVLVHPAPSMPNSKPPFCACLGTRRPPSCRDLPMYAFCGYMKFRHTEFRTTTYELLTESQKHEMHACALLYLERYTRRCTHCDAGCFAKLLGLRTESGLVEESEKLKRTRRQIIAIGAESKICGENNGEDNSEFSLPGDWTYQMMETDGTLMNRVLGRGSETSKQIKQYTEHKHVRSFSSLDLENCECLSILQSVYSQLIDHCQGAREYRKLFDAYLEYADLCICINGNIPQGVRLLSEVETFIQSGKFCIGQDSYKNWMRDFQLASVYSLRGACMLGMGDLIEARKQLFAAMELYCEPFPTSNHRRQLYSVCESMKQLLALYIVPNLYIARYRGITGYFYEDIAKTLNILYDLFTECKEHDNAALAAKWSLNYALRTNSNLRVLCNSYANMISVYRRKQKFGICVKLEKRAMESCRRKYGQLDVTEVNSVCYLYTHVFLFYINWGKKLESLEFGLSVLDILHSVHNSDVLQLLVLWMLKILLCDLKIHDMVSIMTEFLYMTDTYETGSETWYYYYAINILLDTGYSVESLRTCEKFYIKKGDVILKSRTPEAAWHFFVVMWLVTIRTGAWERTIIWEEKISHLFGQPFEKNEFNTIMMVRLIEGLIITLVTEMENKNVKKIIILQKGINTMFKGMKTACARTTMHRPRYYLMLAYYEYIRGKKSNAFKLLTKSQTLARKYGHNVITIWVEHTRNHWKGTLNPQYVDYWIEHTEPDNLLDYRDFNPDKGKIIPFTLPLPTDLEP